MCTACSLQRIHNRSCFVLVLGEFHAHRDLFLWLPYELDSCQDHHIFPEDWNYRTPPGCKRNPLFEIPHEQRKNAGSTDALG